MATRSRFWMNLRFEIAGNALVDPARIHEAVAQNDRPSGYRRTDDFLDMVAARCGKQHGFHAHAEFLRSARQENVPHRLGAPRPSGFTRHQHIVPAPSEHIGQPVDLRRLADALPAFKCNESPCAVRHATYSLSPQADNAHGTSC
jgi:hypothetical protein